MKTCLVDVSIDENDQRLKQAFGSKWINGTTTLILKPMMPWVGGFWDSNRPSDIDSAGGSDHAFYLIEFGNLKVKTGGYDGDMRETHLILNNFDSKIGEAGDGTFFFRQKEWPVYWQVMFYK